MEKTEKHEKIEKTNDYTIFKSHPNNRAIDPANVRRLMESIKKRDMLDLKPLIVNEKMELVDGTHRLAAARELQKAVYYKMLKNSKPNDIILLNHNQKRWALEDYLEHYVSQGMQDYIEFKKFKESQGIKMTTAFAYLDIRTNTQDLRGFKGGNYKFKDNQLTEMYNRSLFVNQISDFIKMKTLGNRKYLTSAAFIIAINNLFNCKSFELSIFMQKLEQRLDMMGPRTTAKSYLNLFKEIYNYKNHQHRIE